ncbi:hypothetical protein PIB30_038861 [Stylosanthes scabra]|uniref:Uncharacterized protein n=1 Tax=Stylosanthes scabra TaxID=79078 RepID=A0ABU6WH09_9FABA|nr:hypothetical protein [Stylosanthes scabra]
MDREGSDVGRLVRRLTENWRSGGRQDMSHEKIMRYARMRERKKQNKSGERAEEKLLGSLFSEIDPTFNFMHWRQPGIVDNSNIPNYQPHVHGGCDPSALSPLQMSAIPVEVDCHLDITFVTVSGVWRVHCVCRRGGAQTEADRHSGMEEDEQDDAKKMVLTGTLHLRWHAIGMVRRNWHET